MSLRDFIQTCTRLFGYFKHVNSSYIVVLASYMKRLTTSLFVSLETLKIYCMMRAS